MKYINKVLLVLMVLTISITGCDTEKLHDLNINPQAVNEIDLNFFFSNALLGTASGGATGDNRFIDWRTNIGMFGMAIQHIANAGGGIANGDKYTDNFEVNLAPWEWWYGGQLKLIEEIEKQTMEGNYAEGRFQNALQASRIIRAWTFHKLTDYYGSVPYDEANQGIEGTFFPAYEKQKAVYEKALAELEDAASKISTSNLDDGFSTADFSFNGDISKWKKFAYSVMLRMAMRVSNVDAQMANTWVTKAIAGGVMETNDDNLWVPTSLGPSEWANQNGISRAFWPGDGGQPGWLSKTLVDQLKGPDVGSVVDDDPRLMIFSGGIALWTAIDWTVLDGDPLNQKGMPNGLDHPDLEAIEGGPIIQDETYSRINILLLDDDEPYQLMNAAEVHFLIAEALERGIGSGISGTAKDHYETGVRTAMQQYTAYDASFVVSDAAVDQYLAVYPYGVTKPALEMIYDQLWINSFFNWWEGWSNWRRTGFPDLVPTNHPSNVTGGQIPRRLLYPNSEIATNFENMSAGTSPNDYLTRVWWDGGAE